MTGSTRTIGLVAMHLDQYGPAQTLIGLEKAAREAGYSLSVAILDHATAGEMRDAVDRLLVQKVDAVVALSTYDAAAQALGRTRSAGPARHRAGGPGRQAGRRSASTRRRARAWRPATCSTSGTARCTTSRARSDSQEARARVAGWRAELEDVDAPVPAYESGDWTPASGLRGGTSGSSR